MDHILYSTDFSKPTIPALRFARLLSGQTGARLTLCNVFDNPSSLNFDYKMDQGGNAEDVVKFMQERLQEFGAAHSGEGDLNADYHALKHASVNKGLMAAVESLKPDALILGTHGKSRVKEFFLGSTTRHMIREAPVPVICVPEVAIPEKLNRIAYCTDLADIDMSAIAYVARMFGAWNPEITVVHVQTSEDEEKGRDLKGFEQKLREHLHYPNLKFVELFTGSVAEELMTYLDAHTDLCVMMEHGPKNALARIFAEDRVISMELQSTFPLMSVPEQMFRY